MVSDAGPTGITIQEITSNSGRLISKSAARRFCYDAVEKGVVWMGKEGHNRHRFFALNEEGRPRAKSGRVGIKLTNWKN